MSSPTGIEFDEFLKWTDYAWKMKVENGRSSKKKRNSRPSSPTMSLGSLSETTPGSELNERALSNKEMIYKKAFDSVDVDGSGEIDAKEMGQLLKEIGWEHSPTDIKAALDFLDNDGNNGEYLHVIVCSCMTLLPMIPSTYRSI